MVTGILLALIGVLVHYAGAKWIDIIMPPVVNGAIVAIIGFNLAPSVWNNFKVAPDTAIVTLVAVLLVAVLFKGLLGRLNILIGVIIGYAYACFRGQVDFSAIGKAAWSVCRNSVCRRSTSPSCRCSSRSCSYSLPKTSATSSPSPR